MLASSLSNATRSQLPLYLFSLEQSKAEAELWTSFVSDHKNWLVVSLGEDSELAIVELSTVMKLDKFNNEFPVGSVLRLHRQINSLMWSLPKSTINSLPELWNKAVPLLLRPGLTELGIVKAFEVQAQIVTNQLVG